MLKNVRLLAILVLMFVNLSLYAQTTINLKVKQSIGSKAKLQLYTGKNPVTIDSCRANDNGEYKFTLSSNAIQGLYRITVGKSSSFDFIVSNEPLISFETIVFAVEDSLKVLVSKENEVFVQYQKLKRISEQQRWLIGSLLNYYDKSSQFAQQLRDEHQRIEFDFYQKSMTLATEDTSLFASNYINLDINPFVLEATDECSYKKQLAQVWWNGVNLTDSRLLNTPILIKKLWDYIENCICENDYDKEQQDSVFIDRIDALFKKSMSDSIKSKFVTSLCNGFAESDYYPVLNYLLKNGGTAADVLRKDEDMMAKLNLEQLLTVGNKAYDFKIKPLGGNAFKLSSDKSPYKLVVFWSVWCPHCLDMIPRLKLIYNDYHDKGLNVIAISIDEEEKDWVNYVKDNNLTWCNMQIKSRDDDPIILRYNVDETPKMFLVDKNMRIVSRPSSAEQLKVKLTELFHW